jgi:hypothetical protein
VLMKITLYEGGLDVLEFILLSIMFVQPGWHPWFEVKKGIIGA